MQIHRGIFDPQVTIDHTVDINDSPIVVVFPLLINNSVRLDHRACQQDSRGRDDQFHLPGFHKSPEIKVSSIVTLLLYINNINLKHPKGK